MLRKSAQIISAFLLFMFLTGPVCADSVEDCLDEIRFIDLEVIAVVVEMKAIFLYPPKDIEESKQAFRDAVARLSVIDRRLESIVFPEEIRNLKVEYIKLIDILERTYSGAESKSFDEIKIGFDEFDRLYSDYVKNFVHYTQQARETLFVGDISGDNEQIKLVRDEDDRGKYRSAVSDIAAQKYEGAYSELLKLEKKYEGTPLGDCVSLKISDCLAKAPNIGEADSLYNPDQAIKRLSAIIDSGRYSPILYEAFYKWRTLYQEWNHGMSNSSLIPNDGYNQRRRRVISTIKQYLTECPDNNWARAQVNELLDLANIDRGGPIGNTNLTHLYRLYYDTKKQPKAASS